MAGNTRGSDETRRKPPAAQSDRKRSDRGIHPDKDSEPKLPPDDGGAESDRASVVKQDRNFDSGPAPR